MHTTTTYATTNNRLRCCRGARFETSLPECTCLTDSMGAVHTTWTSLPLLPLILASLIQLWLG
jgi:hypothetical protein